MSTESSDQADGMALRVPMSDVTGFVRQLSHDLRNHLNSAELQSAYIKEVAEDPELKSEVQRLRGMLSEMGNSLQRLTVSLAPPRLTTMRYEAAELFEDLQQKIRGQFPEKSSEVAWQIDVGKSAVEIDPQLMEQALLELFANAFRHDRGAGEISLKATAQGELQITVSEPKNAFSQSTGNWGREPFHQVKHGHYGLGLHRVRTIIEAHRGRFDARHDSASSSLVTTIILPLAADG